MTDHTMLMTKDHFQYFKVIMVKTIKIRSQF